MKTLFVRYSRTAILLFVGLSLTTGSYFYTHPEEKDNTLVALNQLLDNAHDTFKTFTPKDWITVGITLTISLVWIMIYSTKIKSNDPTDKPIIVVHEVPNSEHNRFVVKAANARLLREQLNKDKIDITNKQSLLSHEILYTEEESATWVKALDEREKSLRIAQEEYAKVLDILNSQKNEYARNKDQLEDIGEELEHIKSII